MSEEIKNEVNENVKEKETTGIKFPTKTASGFIGALVIVLVMLILNWCGVIKFENKETVIKYSQGIAATLTAGYCEANKQELTNETANEIVTGLALALNETADKIANENFDSSNISEKIVEMVNAKIDENMTTGSELCKQLSYVVITQTFVAMDKYTNDVSAKSTDYADVLKAIANGIKQGYLDVYPEENIVDNSTVEVEK